MRTQRGLLSHRLHYEKCGAHWPEYFACLHSDLVHSLLERILVLHWGMQTLGPCPRVPIIAETNLKPILLLTFWGFEGQKLSEDGKWRTFILMNTRMHASVCRNKRNIRLGPQHPFHTVIDGNYFLSSPVICLLSFSHPFTQSLQQTWTSWSHGRTRRNAQSSGNLKTCCCKCFANSLNAWVHAQVKNTN